MERTADERSLGRPGALHRMHYLDRRRTHFLLWLPAQVARAPTLVLTTLDAHGLPQAERSLPLSRSALLGSEVWEIAAGECALAEDSVYHYWFELDDTSPYRARRARLRITDPGAFSVDWRVLAPVPAGYADEDRAPAALIRHAAGRLLPADPGPPLVSFADQPDVAPDLLPTNERLVIYELPSAWTQKSALVSAQEVGVGSFQDVRALVDPHARPPSFLDVPALGVDRAHLLALGINALELLPPYDSFEDRSKWGYGTSHYFAPDFDLGRPRGQDTPSACADLLALVRTCHQQGIRVLVDVVMAFAKHHPYAAGDYLDYFVQFNAAPRDPEQSDREGFGGDLWKCGFSATGWDPVTGTVRERSPARQFHLAHLAHWVGFFHVDGFRLDSVNNVRSWDFVGEFRDEARRLWSTRWAAELGAAGGAASFLVVGEELSVPKALLERLDGLWNEHFRRRIRNALLGRNVAEQPSFEWTVRELVDGRTLGFTKLTQMINYLGSHDLTNTDGDGVDNDRLYDFLGRFGVVEREPRIKLGFVCLLTAVGVPMIFAGDEFADQMDFERHGSRPDDTKQTDPINFDRVEEPWRRRVFEYVSRLVKLRVRHDALASVDTSFIHVDFSHGKRVFSWRRGSPDQDPVLVVANFSDWASDMSQPDAEYRVTNWPATPAGRHWREVTQERDVPDSWAGREPIFPWEAKVYVLV